MTTTITNINLTTSDGQNFVTPGNKERTVIDCRNALNSVAGGTRVGPGVFQVSTGIVQASATATCAAVVANDTITINGTALTAKKQRATQTLTGVTVVANDTVTINTVVFTAKAAITDPATQFLTKAAAPGGTDAASMADLARAINVNPNPLVHNKVTATSLSNVVTVRAIDAGNAANSIGVSATGGTVTAGATTLLGGIAVANNEFECGTTSTNTQVAEDMVRAITNSTTANVSKCVTATNTLGVVTVTAHPNTFVGIAGNRLTFVSSNGTRLAVTGSGFLASGTSDTSSSWNF
jgi:hypothetical protein